MGESPGAATAGGPRLQARSFHDLLDAPRSCLQQRDHRDGRCRRGLHVAGAGHRCGAVQASAAWRRPQGVGVPRAGREAGRRTGFALPWGGQHSLQQAVLDTVALPSSEPSHLTWPPHPAPPAPQPAPDGVCAALCGPRHDRRAARAAGKLPRAAPSQPGRACLCRGRRGGRCPWL